MLREAGFAMLAVVVGAALALYAEDDGNFLCAKPLRDAESSRGALAISASVHGADSAGQHLFAM